MVKDIYHASLADIMPPSVAGDPQIEAMIAALDDELRSLSIDTRDAMIYSRVDELPERVLNVLGWAVHADFWDDRLAIKAKRYHIKNSILMHMRKGTRDAIISGLRMIGAEAEISAWHEYGGENPYHFRIDALITDETTEALAEEEVTALVREVIDATKSERDTLDALRLGILLEDWVYRVNEDIVEELSLEPLYTFADSIDYPGQVYGDRHLYGAQVRYGPLHTYGTAAKYGGPMLSSTIRYGKGWEELALITVLNGFKESVRGATQHYGHAEFGEGDVYGLDTSVVDGGIGLRVARETRYGAHHDYSGGITYGGGTRCGAQSADYGGGRQIYGYSEFTEVI